MADDLVLNMERPGFAGCVVSFAVEDGRLWVRVEADDFYYSGEMALSTEQTDALSALIAQTPTRL